MVGNIILKSKKGILLLLALTLVTAASALITFNSITSIDKISSEDFNSIVSKSLILYTQKRVSDSSKEIDYFIADNITSFDSHKGVLTLKENSNEKVILTLKELFKFNSLSSEEIFWGLPIIKHHVGSILEYLTDPKMEKEISPQNRNLLNAFCNHYLLSKDSLYNIGILIAPYLKKQMVLFNSSPELYSLSLHFYSELLKIVKVGLEKKLEDKKIKESEALLYFDLLHQELDHFQLFENKEKVFTSYKIIKDQFPSFPELDKSFQSYQEKCYNLASRQATL